MKADTIILYCKQQANATMSAAVTTLLQRRDIQNLIIRGDVNTSGHIANNKPAQQCLLLLQPRAAMLPTTSQRSNVYCCYNHVVQQRNILQLMYASYR